MQLKTDGARRASNLEVEEALASPPWVSLLVFIRHHLIVFCL